MNELLGLFSFISQSAKEVLVPWVIIFWNAFEKYCYKTLFYQ